LMPTSGGDGASAAPHTLKMSKYPMNRFVNLG
jgi:hypothetical protein